MQVTINAPDNLPQAFIQQQIKELEAKFKQQANRLTTRMPRSQALLIGIYTTLSPVQKASTHCLNCRSWSSG